MELFAQFREALMQLLIVAEYGSDKDDFTDRTLAVVSTRAILDTLETLPQNKLQELNQLVENNNFAEDLLAVYQAYINEDLYKQNLKKNFQSMLSDFAQDFLPLASEEQVAKIQHILDEFTVSLHAN